MAPYRIRGNLAHSSTARMADEIPSPQRLPAVTPSASAARLRQLAADKRREAKAHERHIPPHDSTASRHARQRVTELRQAARDLEAQAGKLEAGR